MLRGSKRYSVPSVFGWWACACAACLSCAAAPPKRAASAAQVERRAPGVAETRSAELPEPVRAGDSSAQLLLLRAPAAAELARSAVRDFMRATVSEAPERLDALLSAQAVVDTGAGRQPARSYWRSRFSQLDYTELKGQLLFRDSDLQTFRAEDLTRLPSNRRIPLELSDDEIAVRVPIRVSWTGRTRLFGDELLFRLQPAGSTFEIVEINEDFRLP
jgi:hypothetical protein